jgi:hypothetical protein
MRHRNFLGEGHEVRVTEILGGRYFKAQYSDDYNATMQVT